MNKTCNYLAYWKKKLKLKLKNSCLSIYLLVFFMISECNKILIKKKNALIVFRFDFSLSFVLEI